LPLRAGSGEKQAAVLVCATSLLVSNPPEELADRVGRRWTWRRRLTISWPLKPLPYTVSHQLIEQCLGVLEDWGVESFREPAVDRREEVAGLGEFALVVLETCKLEGCT
jgi:hypothetical protein